MEKGELAARIALLKPLRLRLEVPLEGPYTRLMRRPAPEVECLGSGNTIAIVRATRIGEPAPLYPAVVSCYYVRRGNKRQLTPEDFQDYERAGQVLEENALDQQVKLHYLLVPVGYVQLPTEKWVSGLTARLTPWSEKAVERWRCQIRRSIWLNVVRVYRCDELTLKTAPSNKLAPRIPPLRLSGLKPVLNDEAFAEKLEGLLEEVGQNSGPMTTRYSQNSASGMGEEKQEYGGGINSVYSREDFAAETGFDQARLRDWEQRLERKKQVILYGPPGTGKTFVAERLARRLTSGGRGFGDLIQFHPSYAYEDFIQGIRPRTEAGGVVYELAEGRFLEFCRRAQALDAKTPCVLIIDEINRANLAQVFGELMYLLEYRDRRIALSGGGEWFRIPSNVYLIGTMNTADRSIALVDQALRRRFSFIRMKPDLDVLDRFLKKCGYPSQNLMAVVEEINRGIDPDCQLGISFFMKEPEGLRQVLPQIWQGEIEPYLEEVFYDQPEKMEGFRWSTLGKTRLQEWV
jgi:hypothetical protein